MSDSTTASDGGAVWSPSDPQDERYTTLRPIQRGERFQSMDVLRGFALLGIFVMNIPRFALLGAAYLDPSVDGGFEGVDFAAWLFSHTFFELKMMAIFSMLFGAGIVMMTIRSEKSGAPLAGVFYRRIGWLFVFGLVHAYFIWEGDILVLYAMCGAIVFLMRKWRPRTLIAAGAGAMCVAILLGVLAGIQFDILRSLSGEAALAVSQGEEPTEVQAWAQEAWKDISADFTPTPEMIEESSQAFLGSYLDLFAQRAPMTFWMQTALALQWGIWRAGGLMLIGMGLFKLGVLQGERSNAFYIKLMLVGYGLGLPIVLVGVKLLVAHDFDVVDLSRTDWHFNYVGSVGVAMGHIGAVMLICKSGMLRKLREALAAVGRMAFSNYLMQSLIGAIMFYGWGLGEWGSWSRAELLLVVGAVWIVQLIVSPLWLRRFRFGPAEWLWRSLTYWKMQPILIRRD